MYMSLASTSAGHATIEQGQHMRPRKDRSTCICSHSVCRHHVLNVRRSCQESELCEIVLFACQRQLVIHGAVGVSVQPDGIDKSPLAHGDPCWTAATIAF